MKRKTVLILLMSFSLLSAGCSQADTAKTAASENTTSSTGEDHAIEEHGNSHRGKIQRRETGR